MASYEEVFEGYFKLLKKYLKYTKGLNTKLLNVHLNEGPVVTISGEKNYIYDKEFDKYIEYLIKNLRKIEKECNKYNIKLVIENITIPPYLEKTYKRLIQEGFNFNYDIGHDHTSGDVLKRIMEENEMKFLEFHVHDSTKTKCHLELGLGELDINYYTSIAKDSYVVLEVKSSADLINSVKKIK
jgi:sugar phosphate isomerase/epimerase